MWAVLPSVLRSVFYALGFAALVAVSVAETPSESAGLFQPATLTSSSSSGSGAMP